MKFNLKDLNPGAWFYFNEDDPDDGGICLRVLTTGKLAQIRNETVKTQVEYHNENRHEFQTIDHAARDKIIWEYCIVDWQNLTDDEGIPIECTAENKLKLMNGHPNFSAFVENCLVKLNAEMEMISEHREKN